MVRTSDFESDYASSSLASPSNSVLINTQEVNTHKRESMRIKISGVRGKGKIADLKEAVEFFSFFLLKESVFNQLSINIKVLPECENDNQGLCIPKELDKIGKNPRKFEILIKKHKDFADIIKTLAHEMVHVKQFAKGELGHEMSFVSKGNSITSTSTYWKGRYWRPKHVEDEYWDAPWEIEAHGREVGLYKKWKEYCDMKKYANIRNL